MIADGTLSFVSSDGYRYRSGNNRPTGKRRRSPDGDQDGLDRGSRHVRRPGRHLRIAVSRSQNLGPGRQLDPLKRRVYSCREAHVDLIAGSHHVVALTGAGLSVESGIPPFRGPGGLWEKYGEPPLDGYQRFLRDPAEEMGMLALLQENRLELRSNVSGKFVP